MLEATTSPCSILRRYLPHDVLTPPRPSPDVGKAKEVESRAMAALRIANAILCLAYPTFRLAARMLCAINPLLPICTDLPSPVTFCSSPTPELTARPRSVRGAATLRRAARNDRDGEIEDRGRL
jgi:hypothetical protein